MLVHYHGAAGHLVHGPVSLPASAMAPLPSRLASILTNSSTGVSLYRSALTTVKDGRRQGRSLPPARFRRWVREILPQLPSPKG